MPDSACRLERRRAGPALAFPSRGPHAAFHTSGCEQVGPALAFPSRGPHAPFHTSGCEPASPVLRVFAPHSLTDQLAAPWEVALLSLARAVNRWRVALWESSSPSRVFTPLGCEQVESSSVGE